MKRIFVLMFSAASVTPVFAGDLVVPEYPPQADKSVEFQFTEREWKRLDINKNGIITKREGQKMDPKSWVYADLNADGKISRREWDAVSPIAARQASRRPNRNEWTALDLNDDGFVTRAEAAELDAQTFSRLDVDRDGRLSQQEWSVPLVGPGVAGRPAPSPPPFRRFE